MSYSTKCMYLVNIGSLNQAHAFYRVKQSAFISCVCVCVCVCVRACVRGCVRVHSRCLTFQNSSL